MPSSPVDIPEYETQFQQRSDDDDQLWEVREIIREKKGQYLVRWDGFDPKTRKPWDPSWVPKHDCTNELIYEWKLTNAKKSQARRKRNPSNDDVDYAPNGARKSNSAETRSKSRSATATFRKPLNDAGPSKLGPNNKASPVVEIVRPKKRPREGRRRTESEPVQEGEGSEAPRRKKRRLSPHGYEKEEEEEAVDEDQEEEAREERHGDDLEKATVQMKPPKSVGTRPTWTVVTSPSESGSGAPEPEEKDELVDEYPLPQYDRARSHGAENGDRGATPFDDNRKPRSGRRSYSLPSPPSPHELLSALTTRQSVVVPETKTLASSIPQANNSRNLANAPRDRRKRKASELDLSSPRSSPSRKLHPVPTISPSAFRSDLPLNSQLSEIETFTSPDKSKGQRRAKRPRLLGSGSENGHPDDSIEDEGNLPNDGIDAENLIAKREVLRQRVASRTAANSDSEDQSQGNIKKASSPNSHIEPRERTALGHSSLADDREDDAKATTSDVMDSYRPPSDPGQRQDSRISSSSPITETDNHFEQRHDVDDLGPEDAPDARDATPLVLFSSSGKADFSLEATGPWTQHSQLFPQLSAIKSPTKQLDSALGLLHRKSEEIHELEQDCNALRKQVEHLQNQLSVAEKRYGQVCTALDVEKLQWEAEKDTISVNEQKIVQLSEENASLSVSNKQLESDNTMLRDIYDRASDSHRRVTAENNTLTRDNLIFREQATTGIRQAGLFWKTQVSTLEKELARVRGTAAVLTDQAKRTDDDVRRRAALLPMAQKETLTGLERIEFLEEKIRELGRENTDLRIEVKGWEDEAMARRKAAAQRREEEAANDELVWVCHWIDAEQQTKCAALLESREKLREHLYEAGHL